MGFAAEWGQRAGDDGEVVGGWGVGGGEFWVVVFLFGNALGGDVATKKKKKGWARVLWDEGSQKRRGGCYCCLLYANTVLDSLHRPSNQFYRL